MININMVVGGVFETNAFASFYQECHRAFRGVEARPYSEAVDEIGVMFFVSGKVRDYGKAGLSTVRRNKRRLIVARWYVPRSVWDGSEDCTIHEYMVASLGSALLACFDRLQRDGEPIDQNGCREIVAGIQRHLAAELIRPIE